MIHQNQFLTDQDSETLSYVFPWQRFKTRLSVGILALETCNLMILKNNI